ncbi:uncharacterized protein LOC135714851 [Ochlerotatus camptorhynchus]|uniref:uncharacterized protein LOC135714851 n=1 Tax=Ochlerotatus camptorhynchus TaxID=644619 RepID=UPI0031E38426
MNFVDNVLGHCRLCTRKDEVQDMVACDQCDRWFHYGCVELTCLPDKKEPWSCAKCRMDESIKKAQADELIQMKNKLANIALELEARAKAQKSSEIHATSMETELAHYKRELESKHKEEKDKRDVLLDIAQAIQLNKVKLENELVRKETAADDDSVAMYLKRQEMGLPQFSGNAREWPAFKKMFEATTEQGKYTSLENLIRLQKALGGPAAKAVQSMMLDQANVPQIMERLEKQFGQSKRVYKELRDDLERIRTGGHLAIVEISNGLENLIAHLTASNQMAYSNDPRLVEELVSKMSCDTQIKWLEVVESNAKQGNSVPSLKDLAKWLKPKADIHRELYNSNRAPIEKRNRVNVHSENNVRCYMCNGTHRLRECQKFGKMSVQNRRQEILKLRVCPLCLFRHKGNCNFQRNCGINGCNEHHHRLLHIPRDIHNQGSRPERRQITASGEPTEPRPETSNLHEEQRAQVFYQIIPVTLKNKNCEVETYAFLDPGSSLTLIDEGVAEELELEGVRDPLKIKWTQNVSREEKTSRRVKLKIKGNSDNEFTLTNVRTASNLHLPVQTVNYDNLADKYPFLANLPIKNYKNAQPKLLIGLNHSHLLYPLERRAMGVNEPIAIKTKLGWLIFGNIKHTAQAEHLMVIQEDDKMNDLMQRYFSVEDFGVKIPEKLPETKNEIRAKEIINKTLKYTGEKYEVGLLWKEDDTHLPESYIQVYKRLQNLEAKLKKDPELKNWTNNTIADYVTKGYARKLTPKEKEEWAGEIFYLPTFIVVNKNKTPPKPRLVFDAAAKSWGISLNDALLAGPDATTSLFGVTTNFREGAIASAGDVQEMFSQVGISLEDQKKQCFLYRDCDDSREPDVYVMQVMIFGSTSSPACAQAVKNYNASLYAETKPKAVKAIIKQHYVDDYIDSFDTPQEATQTIKDVMEIHDKAKFFIRNFVSNSKEVLASLPKNRVQVDKIKTFEDKESEGEKVLGMYWDTSKDCIQYQLKFNRLPVDVRHEIRKPTKREVLSFVMSVYDPMGLIANLTIHGRILIQELHKETSDWDAEISERSYNQWKQFLEIIKQAANVKIPRWMLAPKVQKFELHTFVDASEYAYAAATYVRGLGSHGQTVSIRLLAAKSRVAPIKKLSIPRLELLAAVLGTRLTKTLKKELRKKPSKITYWSDSQTVLSWIHSDHRKYKEFVAHRIGEILEETKIEQWRYVPTDENPADEGTKLAKGKPKWLAGPTFIWKEECMWPKSRFMRETTEEIKESVMFHQEVESDFKFIREYRYSNWEKLLKEVCILKKFVDWIKDKRNFDKNISEDDMQIAEYAIVRKAQWEGFTDEMHDITKHGEITKSGRLRCLTPRINDHEVMVVQSRLANTDIVPLSTREPMILPTKHPITRLIMKFYHEENLHHGDQTILAAAKEKYWIIDPRRVHNTVKANCQHCKNEKVSPSEPLMSCLPDCRLDIYNPAFTHTGVDYFGPIEVQVKRSIEKRWGVIFTCLTSRAVYLDLAEKLDTDAFIVCLRNFQVRRGPVKHLYSDNGTNFIGAEKEMQTAVQEIEREMGEGKAAEMRIKWHFNPPAAPHFGGAWERLIRNIKICLDQMDLHTSSKFNGKRNLRR